VPAAVALIVFAPWLVRDWLVFGNPLPGQAAANALSVTGFDIFAWSTPPTLSRYLAVGLTGLAQMRVDGFGHNLLSVLLLPSFPIGLIGLLRLPWTIRLRALRPLLVVSLLTFWITTLAFPVATTWGTFLHAAGPVHVLLIIACLLALDALFARLSTWRGWTKQVAWLGATLTIATAILFSLSLAGYGQQSTDTGSRYQALAGPDGCDRAAPRRDRRTDHQRLPHLAGVPGWDQHPGPARRATELGGGPGCPLPGYPLPGHQRRARELAGRPGRRWSASRLLSRNPARHAVRSNRGEGPGRDPCLPDRVCAMTSPLYSADMDGTHAEARDGRIDELHAEAKAAVGYAADTVRQIADHYRRIQHEELARLQSLTDELRAERHGTSAASAAGGDEPGGDAAAEAAECGSWRPRRPSARLDPGESTTVPATGPALSNAIFQVEYIERVIVEDPTSRPTELRFLRDLLRRELGDVAASSASSGRRCSPSSAWTARSRRGRPRSPPLTGPAHRDRPRGPTGAELLSEAAQTVVLRIVQEALQNVRKHARRHRPVTTGSKDATGSSRCATMDEASTSARWRPAAGVTSACNSCASGPS
jgi:hypothetical protein